MEVGVTELRAKLSEYLGRARSGEEVLVTERGVPVVRIVGVETPTVLERLRSLGLISSPPSAPKRGAPDRVEAKGPVSTYVSEQRR
jgi:prevent-host-death family protein